MGQLVLTALQISLGVVFLRALVGKVVDLGAFAKTVEAFGIVSKPWSMPVAGAILLSEGVASAGLLTGYRSQDALIITIALTLLFTCTVIWAIQTGRRVDCGCFGKHSGVVSRRTIHRLMVIFSGCIASIVGSELMGIDRITYWDSPDAYGDAIRALVLALGVILFGRLLVAILDAVSMLSASRTTTSVRL
jgi:hypothetical protein